ncbi:uncharacterized protein Z520_10080 [Fonsecaea multimorphosa CBS 102226]|uniref:Uncharacterized protein n=1 Tax=Fonsecaea multimorphosa CBS 102226 TaxID=1442371 RepID=A0A0D2JU81_9EURO|nr:uncharacterized protein Z520_10080 [Fonsecaea multimorphosa CBS 102226]KIX94054.1 hypothetical protein Z520_10080 [Fonsecaea multimorphosa CBS 102226]OAL19408.1 hypothetical protein AYO22_09570 [Fonsecaea multimorphosa]
MPVIPIRPTPSVSAGKGIALEPREAGEHSYWIFFIVLGSIVGFALLSALGGLISARCCSKRGDQKFIEKLAAEIEDTQRTQVVSASASSRSSLTLVEDPIVERRRANMVTLNAVVGQEERDHADKKRSRRSSGRESSSIALPVTLATLRKWAKRSTLSGDHNQRQSPNHTRVISGPGSADPIPTPPVPLHCKSRCEISTSTNYDEPSQLIDDIRSNATRV